MEMAGEEREREGEVKGRAAADEMGDSQSAQWWWWWCVNGSGWPGAVLRLERISLRLCFAGPTPSGLRARHVILATL